MSSNLPEDLPHQIREAAKLHERAREQARSALSARAERSSMQICQALSDAADAWVLAVWEHTAPADLREASALYALGGFGRQELSFGSDLDVLIEVHDPTLLERAETSEIIEQWMRHCRVTRVKLSHAVRSPAQGREELERDWRTPVALLDARALLVGDGVDLDASIAHSAALRALRATDQGTHFVELLIEGYRARRDRHGQTVYLLEPDIKSGLGGLRDVHAVHWASLVRCGASALEANIPEWGFETRHRESLRAASNWLHEVRHHLHLFKGRKHDRLLFPEQEQLARELFPDADNPAEVLMSQHYLHTREVNRLMERSLRRLALPKEREITPLLDEGGGPDERFVLAVGELALAPGYDASRNPLSAADVMRALKLADGGGDAPMLLDARLEQELADCVKEWGEEEREDAALQRLLLELFASHGAEHLTGMRLLELGILEKLIPEFTPLVCHVQHDIYHVYTTDVHTMYCVDRARSLIHGLPDPVCDKWPVFRHIAAEIERPELLTLACFLHDIGKRRGGDHSRKGAALVPEIGRRMQLPEDDIELLATLVREHLILSNTSRRRDISDPRVARDLCAKAPSLEILNLLTTLTFCDMSTVGPESMNDWRAMLLLQLHQRLSHALLEDDASEWEDRKALIAERREQLQGALSPTRNPEVYEQLGNPSTETLRESIHEFLLDLPIAHLASADLTTLTRQLIVYMRVLEDGHAAILSHAIATTNICELVIATRDTPGTLAKIAGVLSTRGINILSASIVTTSSGMVLDVFRIASPEGTDIPLAPSRIERTEHSLARVLDGDEDVEEMLSKRIAQSRLAPRPGPEVDIRVRAYQDASDHFTILEIHAPDRLGLLYEIAATLNKHEVSTHFSTLDGMGNKVVDTFYVEHIMGGKLQEEHVKRLQEALRVTITQSPFLDHPRATTPREAP